MGTQPKKHEYNGSEFTVAQLAKQRGCTPENMHHLIRKYGLPEAMQIPTRLSKNSGSEIKNADHVVVKPFNSKLEKWRRWNAWLKRGWTVDEIRIKEKVCG